MNMVPRIYAFPGLGTDGRIFDPLREVLPLVDVSWLEPEPEESLSAYAMRMGRDIPRDEPVILLGVSLGGIVARELVTQLNCRLLIQISSLVRPGELPPVMRLWRYVPLYRLSRGSWRYRTLPLWAPLFGIREPAEQALLQDMFRQTSDRYRMWAIQALLSWSGQEVQGPCWRYHGTRDRVFPPRYIGEATYVKNGTHFMVYQQGSAIGRDLLTRLQGMNLAAGT
ncbi:MAG: alpha/beta hydrolase [Bacteroidetes bacterium]|nr:MAG: alpha/beta hydrolase [Bacteroidota bacterium]